MRGVAGHFKGRMREWGPWGRIRKWIFTKTGGGGISQPDPVLLIVTYLKEKQTSVFMTGGNSAGRRKVPLLSRELPP